jgi:hypothetical protein
VDISSGGMRVRPGPRADVGEQLDFMLTLPRGTTIRGRAELARLDDTDGSAGLFFTNIADSDRTMLSLAVYDAQRLSDSPRV